METEDIKEYNNNEKDSLRISVCLSDTKTWLLSCFYCECSPLLFLMIMRACNCNLNWYRDSPLQVRKRFIPSSLSEPKNTLLSNIRPLLLLRPNVRIQSEHQTQENRFLSHTSLIHTHPWRFSLILLFTSFFSFLCSSREEKVRENWRKTKEENDVWKKSCSWLQPFFSFRVVCV